MRDTNKERLILAQVGLRALIDEATGFQKERFKDKNALRKYHKELKDRDKKKSDPPLDRAGLIG